MEKIYIYLMAYSIHFCLELETGLVMFDAMTKKQIFVQCPVLCITCDNPKASEICHHLGSSALHFCRECDVCFNITFILLKTINKQTKINVNKVNHLIKPDVHV